MIIPSAYEGKTVGVFGLARSGIAAVRALVAAGATVWAWDDNAERRAAVADHCVDLLHEPLDRLDALMLAPGVPLTHPEPHPLVTRAQKAGVPLISDFDLFQAARAGLKVHRTVAITGTNGKSTTTALIRHMLDYAGYPVVMGGNIGTGVMALDPLAAGGVYVLEVSSFQLDLTRDFKPDIGVLLNITPDHLDRHGTMENYVAAKARLFGLNDQAPAVIGLDDSYCRSIADTLGARAISITTSDQRVADISIADGQLRDMRTMAEPIDMNGIITLKGEHNSQNIAAAYAVGIYLGLQPRLIAEAMRSFPGLAHRQELVPGRADITYINDSKATNMDAAKRALASFRAVHWLAGGAYASQTPPDPADLAGSDIKAAYFYGQDGERFIEALSADLQADFFVDMEKAFAAADAAAAPGDVVLLSPACKAFDLYRDFEVRGDAFKQLVAEAATRARRGGRK